MSGTLFRPVLSLFLEIGRSWQSSERKEKTAKNETEMPFEE
jgi:hypothetical protein